MYNLRIFKVYNGYTAGTQFFVYNTLYGLFCLVFVN
jgi:hypothetical protein